jgi:4-amino-4-deoxychorismate lyase
MSLFFETLRLKDGKIQNLRFHNQRLNHTIHAYYGIKSHIDLQQHVHPKEFTLERCKVLYDTDIKTVQFFPLKPRKVQSLKLLETKIKYNFKYADREGIDQLFLQRGDCDDILMVQDGLVLDTSIANIAYHDGKQWITPRHPLLKGTMRAYLIEKQLLLEKDVKIKDIKKATRFAVMNALVGFHEIQGVKLRE